MKVLWILKANIKGIDFNKEYNEYDDKCLESKYWIDDIISFIKDNDGTIIKKNCKCIDKYEITFDISKYKFNMNEFIKFISGRFYTWSLSYYNDNWNSLYNKGSFEYCNIP